MKSYITWTVSRKLTALAGIGLVMGATLGVVTVQGLSRIDSGQQRLTSLQTAGSLMHALDTRASELKVDGYKALTLPDTSGSLAELADDTKTPQDLIAQLKALPLDATAKDRVALLETGPEPSFAVMMPAPRKRALVFRDSEFPGSASMTTRRLDRGALWVPVTARTRTTDGPTHPPSSRHHHRHADHPASTVAGASPPRDSGVSPVFPAASGVALGCRSCVDVVSPEWPCPAQDQQYRGVRAAQGSTEPRRPRSAGPHRAPTLPRTSVPPLRKRLLGWRRLAQGCVLRCSISLSPFGPRSGGPVLFPSCRLRGPAAAEFAGCAGRQLQAAPGRSARAATGPNEHAPETAPCARSRPAAAAAPP